MANELDEAEACALAIGAFAPRRGTAVYVDRSPRRAGATPLGSPAFRAAVRAVLVFRDEMPGANWMHPCSYALVDPQNGAVLVQVRSDRPPAFGRLPPTWVVASDPDGLADLVPREAPPPKPPR